MTLARALRERAAACPGAEAIVAAGRRTDYSSLDAGVDRLASGLLELGAGRGERVALWVSNREEYLLAYLACARTGATLVPLDMRLSASEVEYVLVHSGAGVLMLQEAFDGRERSAELPRLRRALGTPGAVVTLEGHAGGAVPFADLLCAPDADATIAADDAALIIYTSGTTGRPKGVVLTHRGLAAYAGYAQRVGLFADGDRILIQVPLPTAAGSVIQTVPAISLGAALILLDVFRAETSLELVEAERVTCYVAPPTMLTLQLEAENFAVVDLSSLRHVTTGAAPVAAALAERVVEKMEVRLTNSYGATETGGLVTYVPGVAPGRRATETCGVAIPGYELRIVDEDRGRVEPDEVGEVAVRGAPVMAGYHRAPERTAEVLDEDGWWYSGDLGTLDEDGYLRIVGRAKDMYIRGGYNVYPAEVEAVLERHPAVVACAVVGYDDPVLGEKGRVFVVTAGGRSSADQLREFCRRDLADYKIPDDVRFVDELPLIGPGKVDRAALRGAA